MFCKNCGNIIGDTNKFCEYCGAETASNTGNSALQVVDQSSNQAVQQKNQKPLGMKWYKFVVNIQLFLSMLVCVYNALGYFNRSNEEWELLYTSFPKLKVLNISFGIIQLLYIGFIAVIRYRMVKFKKNAPTLYITNFWIQIFLDFAWNMIAVAITSNGPYYYGSAIAEVAIRNVFFIIYILLNVVYFRKRKFMFDK